MLISSKERKFLLAVGLFLVIVALTDLASIAISKLDDRIEKEQRCRISEKEGQLCYEVYEFSRSNYLRVARLLGLVVFPFLYCSRRFVWSSVLTSLSFLIFTLEVLRGISAATISENYQQIGLIGQVFFIATPLDYLEFLLVGFLLAWQMTIHVRAARKLI